VSEYVIFFSSGGRHRNEIWHKGSLLVRIMPELRIYT